MSKGKLTSGSNRIVVKNISFGKIPFRKLKNVSIDLASRITLIAGHNGIGKSTILGLLAHSSGLTKKSAENQSYFDSRTFQGNLGEIIFIDYDNEFKKIADKNKLPAPVISYEINGETLTKRCALAERAGEARIVPRNYNPSTEFNSLDESVTVGVASKVPLPTIYLGMTRVLPIGEAEAGTATNNLVKSMDEQDRRLIADFVGGIIVGTQTDHSSIAANKVSGTRKVSTHPQYKYDTKCVSLGQDSLGSIATALASFQRLKRKWPAYPGGLLVIDELDAGFHPHAIQRLVSNLKALCDDLNLQIVATTHSTKLIEAVHPGNKKNSPDKVVYIADALRPTLLDPASLENILDDMELKVDTGAAPALPQLKVYLEDDEAAYVFNVVMPAAVKRQIGQLYNVQIKPISMGVGCDSLARFSSKDPYFKNVVIVLDADASKKDKPDEDNIVHLPSKNSLSPEQTLFTYIKEATEDPDAFSDRLDQFKKYGAHGGQLLDKLLNWQGDIKGRKEAKKWWRDRAKYIHKWKLYKVWADENHAAVEAFREEFDRVVRTVSRRIRKLAKPRNTA
jgi:energy-coupling factor transporter ATP-binding protein EcfA2